MLALLNRNVASWFLPAVSSGSRQGISMLLATVASLTFASATTPAFAQRPVAQTPGPVVQSPVAPPPAARPAKPARKPPEDPKMKPRPVTLKTRDNVELRAFFFPSDKGKEAIPVILIHEWQGQGSPYGALVTALRSAGCAVIVPEYRGHGGSRTYTDISGQPREFNLGTMGRRDVENILAYDLEEVKQFLKKENNEGNLNLNALTLIGVREGAIMAMHWAARDWRFPSVGRLKQGQDVKALVLISPEKNFKGLAIDPTLREPSLLRLPVMIVAGADNPDATESERIGKQIESVKRRLARGEAPGYKLELVPTSLSGPALVNEAPEVIPAITSFITASVPISDEQNPWIERE